MNKPIKVAIVGVGNCANSLVQGVEHYQTVEPGDSIPGLMNVQMGDYHIGDLRFVAAFDVDATKVGLDISKAMWAGLNNTVRFAEVGDLETDVLRGPTLDGLGSNYRDSIEESMARPIDVVDALRTSRADVLVNYLPVGSERATRFYAEAALEAGVGFVNCIPVFVASDRSWAGKFRAAGIPIIENLDLSRAEPGDYDLVALPLMMVEAEAAPVRAVLLPAGSLRTGSTE